MAILALVLAACSGGGGSSEAPAESEAAASEPAESEGATGEVVEIRWFCCLGAGDDAETQVPTEEAVVAAFNESHDDIELVLEVVDYDSAYDALAIQIAGGNAPDILGPVGGTGSAAFEGEWLDLTDVIESTWPRSDPVLGGIGRVLPGRGSGAGRTAVRHLPVDAVLPALDVRRGWPRVSAPGIRRSVCPRRRGGRVELRHPPRDREAADRRRQRNDATSADFDATQIEQYGYDPIFQDARAIGSYFGAGSLVAEDGTTAQVPDEWREAWTWHYENIWTEHITMDIALRDAPEFGNGNPFNALRAAMALSHTWYTCCANAVDDDGRPDRSRLGRRRRAVAQRCDDGELQRRHLPDLGRDRASGGGVRGPRRTSSAMHRRTCSASTAACPPEPPTRISSSPTSTSVGRRASTGRSPGTASSSRTIRASRPGCRTTRRRSRRS